MNEVNNIKAVSLSIMLEIRLLKEMKLKVKSIMEIKAKSFLWHIMQMYSAKEINDYLLSFKQAIKS